jgi:hypothetical protein
MKNFDIRLMLNRKLLLVSSGADAPSTIGVAGGQGFGVGV